MDYTLQTEAKVLAAQSKALRKQEIKLRNKRRQSKSLENMDYIGMAREQAYKQRLFIRRDPRYLHLLRAYTSDKTYLSVEQSVRQGNEVDADLLTDYADGWLWPVVTPNADIVKWLEGC